MRFLAITLAAVAIGAMTRAEEPPKTEVVRGNTRCADDLYGRLREWPGIHPVFSPNSISTALAITSAGAEGKTAE